MTAVTVTAVSIPGAAGQIGARVYAPAAEASNASAAASDAPAAALVWLHGGGFSAGSLDMPEGDWVSRSLAERGHTVVSVDYRLATETVRYPAPSDDVLTVWAWVLKHRSELRIAGTVHLGGASAGGNLAAGATMRIRDHDPVAHGAELPTTLILAYPTLHAIQRPPSQELSAKLASLPAAGRKAPDYVANLYRKFLPDAATNAEDDPAARGADPRWVAAVPGAADPTGLPPTLIAGSDADVLRASAEEFVDALAAHDVEHEYFVEPGTEHGHLNRPEEPAATATIERFHTWLRSHDHPAGETKHDQPDRS